MVGFNRRFSPHIKTMKDWLRSTQGDKSVLITVNAGHIPEDHWTQDNAVGGGRIVGEACHFIDLARHLIGAPIANCEGFPMKGGGGRLGDCASIQMAFEDGSIANVLYLANGSKDFPKERIEVFAGGKVFACDNFRSTREYGGKRKFKTRQQDKGHAIGVAEFIASIQYGTPTPITIEEIMEHDGNMNVNFYVNIENAAGEISFEVAYQRWTDDGSDLKKSMENLFEILK